MCQDMPNAFTRALHAYGLPKHICYSSTEILHISHSTWYHKHVGFFCSYFSAVLSLCSWCEIICTKKTLFKKKSIWSFFSIQLSFFKFNFILYFIFISSEKYYWLPIPSCTLWRNKEKKVLNLYTKSSVGYAFCSYTATFECPCFPGAST